MSISLEVFLILNFSLCFSFNFFYFSFYSIFIQITIYNYSAQTFFQQGF